MLPAFESLNGDRKTQVLIIGGGLTGILCAYMLAQAGVDYLLIEAKRLGGGVTGNTTAKITSQHGLIYDKLVREFGIERAQMYLQANESALENYRKMCKTIDCDFETKDNYVYSIDAPRKLEKEIAALDQLGFPVKYTEKVLLPFSVAGAVCFKDQAQFHPLKFISAIVRDLNICENTKAMAYEGRGTIVTDRGRITASKIIVTTHFPIFNKHGSYYLKQYQHRSYVIALKRAPDVDGMYMDEDKKGLSFRNYHDLLLLGGGAHRTGKQGGNWAELSAFARKRFPESREVCRWATQDCMTLDGVPYIGRYSDKTPECYVATGFNKWGMTSAMVAAGILSDLVQDRENPYAPVFSPSRTILRPQLAINAAESITNLLTPTKPRCPHMGCALKWNPREHTWDCPCHGSRFAQNGKLLDNPATDDLKLD